MNIYRFAGDRPSLQTQNPNGKSLWGRILFADGRRPCPILRIAAHSKALKAVAAEAFSSDDGHFVLSLDASHVYSDLTMLVTDGINTELASTAFSPEDSQRGLDIHLSRDASETAVSTHVRKSLPPLLSAGAVDHLTTTLERHVAQGVLEPAVLQSCAAVLRPLLWLSALTTDASAVLEGSPTARTRWRSALLGLAFDPSADLPPDLTARLVRFHPLSRFLNHEALAVLVAATLWAARDEREADVMLLRMNSLLAFVAVLNSLSQALEENLMSVRALMLAPAPPAVPDVGFGDDTPAPGGLGWGGPHLPYKIDLDLFGKPWLYELFKGSVLERTFPFGPELNCVDEGRAAMAAISRAAPPYEIQAIDNSRACPGQQVVLYGTGFGWSGGEVLFPGVSGQIAAHVISWDPGAIKLVVPNDATSGSIELRIYAGSALVCGILSFVYRPGASKVRFDGGVAAIFGFAIDSMTTSFVAEPEHLMHITYETNISAATTAELTISGDDGPMFHVVTAGGSYAFNVSAPKTTTPMKFNAHLKVTGTCGPPVERDIAIEIRKHPALHITGVEVVQAIQHYLPVSNRNSVRLVARRRTLVRVYMESGVGNFDYGHGAGILAKVTGQIRLIKGGGTIAMVAPVNNTVRAFVANQTSRMDINSSLNFLLPVTALEGDVTVEASLQSLDPVPPADQTYSSLYSALDASTHVTFHERRSIRLALTFLQDDFLKLPGPTLQEVSGCLDAASSRYPIAEDGFDLVFPTDWSTLIHSKLDLRTKDGWATMNDDLREMVEDDPNAHNTVWAAFVSVSPPPPDDYFCGGYTDTGPKHSWIPILASQTLPHNSTFPHELGHALGLIHSPCNDGATKASIGNTSAFPGRTEDVGVDTYPPFGAPLSLIPAGQGDLMSYCDPGAGWPSVALWEYLFDFLHP